MNLEEKLEWLKNEIKDLEKQLGNKSENKKYDEDGNYLPKKGEEFYLISDAFEVDETMFLDEWVDKLCLKTGNFFPKKIFTREQVEQIAEYRLERAKIEAIMNKYSRDFEVSLEPELDGYPEIKNYIIALDHENGIVVINTDYIMQWNTYYFYEKEANKVIELCGEDKLCKYWFTSEREFIESEVILYCIK